MNPKTREMRERIEAYHRAHPEYRQRPEQPPRRKKMFTQKRLKPGTQCAYCGKILTKYTVTIDHIVPISRGGTDDPENLCWSCKQCNFDKANQLLSEWRREEDVH